MNTFIVYILTSVTLSILLAIVRSNEYKGLGGSVEVFCYPSSLQKIFIILLPLWPVLGLLMCFRTGAWQGNWKYGWIFCFISTIMFLQVFAYKYFKAFRVVVDGNGIQLFSLFKTKNILFRDVVEVILLQGGKGGHVLTLKGQHGKELLRLSESIGGFQELVRVTRERSEQAGAKYKCRDKWGKWS